MARDGTFRGLEADSASVPDCATSSSAATGMPLLSAVLYGSSGPRWRTTSPTGTRLRATSEPSVQLAAADSGGPIAVVAQAASCPAQWARPRTL